MVTYLLRGLPHKHETLRVRDNLGRIESLLEIINKELLVATERLLGRTGDDFACSNTFVLDGRQASREDSLTNEGD